MQGFVVKSAVAFALTLLVGNMPCAVKGQESVPAALVTVCPTCGKLETQDGMSKIVVAEIAGVVGAVGGSVATWVANNTPCYRRSRPKTRREEPS